MSDGRSDRALRLLFFLAGRAPWVLRALRPLAVRLTPRLAPAVRENVEANARRLLGHVPAGFARDTVGSFYDFVLDIGQAQHASADQLRSRIIAIEGKEAYLATRANGGGVMLVTAHMGSFEVGLAALRQVESDVHVVFKRDAFSGFETLRQQVRQTLGVNEAPIDDGWPTLMKLRDALRAGAAVVMQADRAMPGQKSAAVRFGGGTLRVPLGPIKLAMAADCCVVPVFTVREPSGHFRVYLEPAIDPAAADAVEQVAAAVEKFVRQYPTQWLVLHRAFVEDEAS